MLSNFNFFRNIYIKIIISNIFTYKMEFIDEIKNEVDVSLKKYFYI